ncbi:hypothetical protein PoB_005373000 [Plakobranchus ocellatus]|uniref:Uncharacterized protein n=1 Tax=Plakobranchus ocellatus TaxID=259542 RepID=A0AAV4C705_9GAST|nr:hypothetical protein PoB_005373000 [Plakobranchus ocellatus]
MRRSCGARLGKGKGEKKDPPSLDKSVEEDDQKTDVVLGPSLTKPLVERSVTPGWAWGTTLADESATG